MEHLFIGVLLNDADVVCLSVPWLPFDTTAGEAAVVIHCALDRVKLNRVWSIQNVKFILQSL